MDVLIATPNVAVGDGQSRVNYELARYLVGGGHRVTLLADQVDANLIEQQGIDWRRLRAHVRLPALVRGILWSRQATAWLAHRAHQFDIVHLNGASAFVPHQVNTCHFVHGSFREYLRSEGRQDLRSWYHRVHSDFNFRAERRAYALARRVVAVSAKTARELEEIVGVPREKLEVVYNGVDTSVFRPDAEARERVRRELGIAPDTFGLLFVGEFVGPHKGLRTLLEAVHGLPGSTHAFVVGKGSTAAYAAVLKGIAARVHFLGYRSDVRDLYAAMDCFVYPTRYDSFGLVVLEALAAGIPVITTRESGSGELIESGREGVLLDGPRDVEDLRQWIVRLEADRVFAAEMGRRGRLVAKNNSWLRMAERYVSLYEDESHTGLLVAMTRNTSPPSVAESAVRR